MQRMPCLALLIYAIVLAGLAGCGTATPKIPNTVPFSGKVTLDGAPLDDALVTFILPDGKKGALNAYAKTDKEGKYELKVGVGRTEKPGAIPGTYKVTVNRAFTTLQPSKPPPLPMPEKYVNIAKTELKATIPDQGGKQDFELKSK
jgi:hypothetical protein